MTNAGFLQRGGSPPLRSRTPIATTQKHKQHKRLVMRRWMSTRAHACLHTLSTQRATLSSHKHGGRIHGLAADRPFAQAGELLDNVGVMAAAGHKVLPFQYTALATTALTIASARVTRMLLKSASQLTELQ